MLKTVEKGKESVEIKFKISYGATKASHGPNQQLDQHFITSATEHTCSNPSLSHSALKTQISISTQFTRQLLTVLKKCKNKMKKCESQSFSENLLTFFVQF